MTKWNKKFDYPASIRSLVNDQRHYEIGQEKLPSVTTILQATQSDERKQYWHNGGKMLAKIRQKKLRMKQRTEELLCIGS